MRKKVAFVLTLVMTAVIVALRIGAVPAVNTLQLGSFTGMHLIIGLMLLTILVTVLLCWKPADELRRPVDNRPLSGGVVCVFVGSVLLLKMLYDTWAWLFLHIVPSPNTEILNTADGVTLCGTLICGVLAGVAFIWQGFVWMGRGQDKPGNGFYWMALTPSLWMWFRLARYEISYASTVDIIESFFDFMLLISTLLFIFAFARFTTGIGKPPRLMLLMTALATVLAGGSASVIKLMHLIGGVNSDAVTGIVDVAMTLLALYIAVLQVFGKPPKAPVEAAVSAPAERSGEFPQVAPKPVPADSEQKEMTVDDVLHSLGIDEEK